MEERSSDIDQQVLEDINLVIHIQTQIEIYLVYLNMLLGIGNWADPAIPFVN